MLERIVQASDALRQSAGRMRLMPAMKGCPECGTRYVIAFPSLGICDDCGSALRVLDKNET